MLCRFSDIEPTVITEKPQDTELSVETGMVAKFICTGTTDASTPLDISWWHGATRIYPTGSDPRFSLSPDFTQFTVDLTGTSEEDQIRFVKDPYSCNVTNGYSPTSVVFYLAVKGVDPTTGREYFLVLHCNFFNHFQILFKYQ